MEIKEYLFRYKLTEKVFAQKVGVSRVYVSLLSNRNRQPSFELALEIEKKTDGVVTKEELRPDIWK